MINMNSQSRMFAVCDLSGKISSYLSIKDAIGLFSLNRQITQNLNSPLLGRIQEIIDRDLVLKDPITSTPFTFQQAVRYNLEPVFTSFTYVTDRSSFPISLNCYDRSLESKLSPKEKLEKKRESCLVSLGRSLSHNNIGKIKAYTQIKKEELSKSTVKNLILEICGSIYRPSDCIYEDSSNNGIFFEQHPLPRKPSPFNNLGFTSLNFTSLDDAPTWSGPTKEEIAELARYNEKQRTDLPLKKINLIKFLIQEFNIDVRLPSSDGRTYLSEAIASGQIDLIKFLVLMRVDVNERVSFPRSNSESLMRYPDYSTHPLFKSEALSSRDPSSESMEIFKCLVDSGADVNAADQHGYTLLMKAVKKGSVTLVQYLLNQPEIDLHKTVPDDYDDDCFTNAKSIVKTTLGSLTGYDYDFLGNHIAYDLTEYKADYEQILIMLNAGMDSSIA